MVRIPVKKLKKRISQSNQVIKSKLKQDFKKVRTLTDEEKAQIRRVKKKLPKINRKKVVKLGKNVKFRNLF